MKLKSIKDCMSSKAAPVNFLKPEKLLQLTKEEKELLIKEIPKLVDDRRMKGEEFAFDINEWHRLELLNSILSKLENETNKKATK